MAPDFKTIADFRRANGNAIRHVCRQFVMPCRQLDLFSQSLVAIDGSKFKAVNDRDRNFTQDKVRARMERVEKSIDCYLEAKDTIDRKQSDVAEAKACCLQDKIEKLQQQTQALKEMEQQLRVAPDGQVSLEEASIAILEALRRMRTLIELISQAIEQAEGADTARNVLNYGLIAVPCGAALKTCKAHPTSQRATTGASTNSSPLSQESSGDHRLRASALSAIDRSL